MKSPDLRHFQGLSDPTEIPPLSRTGVAIPLSHCVFCGIADYRCYTPNSFRKSGLSQSKERPWEGGIAEKACPMKPIALQGASHEIVSPIALYWDTRFRGTHGAPFQHSWPLGPRPSDTSGGKVVNVKSGIATLNNLGKKLDKFPPSHS